MNHITDICTPRRARRAVRAFTLMEMLVVIVIVGVLAAVVVPKLVNRTTASKESALKSDLSVLRTAVQNFQTDCGCYPSALSSLTATSAPAKGVDGSGNSVNITAANWQGPYLQGSVPNDPVAAAAFTYSNGTVTSSATGNGSNGTAYNTW